VVYCRIRGRTEAVRARLRNEMDFREERRADCCKEEWRVLKKFWRQLSGNGGGFRPVLPFGLISLARGEAVVNY
jgi:hypothetical protein